MGLHSVVDSFANYIQPRAVLGCSTMKMTYKRWKEIDKHVRNPYFSALRCEDYGITKDELTERAAVHSEYSKIEQSKFRRKMVAIVVAIFFSIFAISMGIGLVQNYFRTHALETLTGKDLSYWDVFFASDVIRANAEMQNSQKDQ